MLSECLGPATRIIVKHKQFHLVIQELRFNSQRSSLNFVIFTAKKVTLERLPQNSQKIQDAFKHLFFFAKRKLSDETMIAFNNDLVARFLNFYAGKTENICQFMIAVGQ